MKIFEIGPSKKLLYLSVLLNILLFIVAGSCFMFLKEFINENFATITIGANISKLVTIILVIIVIHNISKTWIKVSTVHYTLTDKTLLVKSGVFNLKIENLDLFRVIDISQFYPFHYRLFGLADIVLHTADKTTPILVLQGIENYEEIETKLKDALTQNKAKAIESLNIDADDNEVEE